VAGSFSQCTRAGPGTKRVCRSGRSSPASSRLRRYVESEQPVLEAPESGRPVVAARAGAASPISAGINSVNQMKPLLVRMTSRCPRRAGRRSSCCGCRHCHRATPSCDEELPRRETKAVGNLRAIGKLVRPRESGSFGVGGGGQDKAQPLRQRCRARAQPAVSDIGGGTGVEWGRLPAPETPGTNWSGRRLCRTRCPRVPPVEALGRRLRRQTFAGHPLGDQRKRLVVGIAIGPARSGANRRGAAAARAT